MSSTNQKLVIRDATKYYDTQVGTSARDRQILNMEVKDGEFACVVGPSGCGKTTLLWSVAGLHPLTSGDVLLDDEPVTGPHPQIGMVFQEANLLPWRNLDRNIRFPVRDQAREAGRKAH